MSVRERDEQCHGREHAAVAQLRRRRSVRSMQTFFTRPSVSTFDRVGPFQLTDEHFLYGTTLRKNNRFRVFNGQIVRLGAENMNGEPFVVFDAKLTGCLLYTSPSPRDLSTSRMPSSA